jgi:DNA mismatch endonuclease (patch repair protein)
MTDTLSKAARSARLSLVRGKDTKPELRVRHFVHRMGYRYRYRLGDRQRHNITLAHRNSNVSADGRPH